LLRSVQHLDVTVSNNVTTELFSGNSKLAFLPAVLWFD